ncbi:hypothetical protein EKO04_011428 [Ascochyta lentis]|uniref:F-box domain-containing protein n=1 Tax=Ascochyta lentis TaxID=205686 RepID=A0A8H7ISK3_9PLEO|nr:hypothetical protein EKO04_011428 [Ascochyta lentis]
MGSWDCYCALCSGPLGIYSIHVGDTTTGALAKRKEAIMAKRGELQRQRPQTSTFTDVDEGSEKEMGSDEEEKDEMHLEPVLNTDDSRTENIDLGSVNGASQVAEEDTDMEVDDVDHDSDNDNDDNDNDDNDDARSENSDLGFRLHHGMAPTDDMYDYYEGCSFDPRLLALEDIKWLDRCRTLGYNAQASGITKAFISGLGRYDDYGSFRIKKPGNDPNDIGADEYDCYRAGGGDIDDSTFPFHEACYRVLARNLGYEDPKEIDKDVLYGIMRQCSEEWGSVLNLDYGGVEAEQFWSCQPGEEYTVCRPDKDLNTSSILPSLMPAKLLHTSTTPDLFKKVQHDALNVLPFDILYTMFQHLKIQDILNLMQASWHVYSLTRDRSFWRQMIRSHLAPWFWELDRTAALFEAHPNLDYKGMFLWLNMATHPKCGMEGPFMGIANRRRIWNVCEQLSPIYNLKVCRTVQEELDHEEAKAVLDTAVSLHMPMVMYPQPKNAHTTSIQFIRSWNEVGNQASDLETYFREQDGALIGISVNFGNGERLFGSKEGKKGQSMHIRAHDWVQEIVVYLREIDMFNRNQDRSDVNGPLDARPYYDSMIHGLSIKFTSGNSKDAKRPSYHSQRAYTVLPGMHLIGLTGEITADGTISRLGLLQAFRPNESPSALPQYTFAQRALWDPHASSVLITPAANAPLDKPFESHPNISIHHLPITPQRSPIDIPPDMRTHQLLHWGRTPHQLKNLRCISALQVQGGTIGRHGRAVPYYDIIGMRPGYTPHSSLPPSIAPKPQHVGTLDPVPTMYGIEHWNKQTKWHGLEIYKDYEKFDPRFLKTFDVDGAGGEIINSIAISQNAGSVKLTTNWGRHEIFGHMEEEEHHYEWVGYEAKEGEVVVGLSVSFSTLSGWSSGATMWSHWTVRELGVMLQRVDEAGNW